MQLTFLKLAHLCKDWAAELRKKKKQGSARESRSAQVKWGKEGQLAEEARAKWAIRHFNELVFKSTIYSLKIEHVQQLIVTRRSSVGLPPVGLLMDVVWQMTDKQVQTAAAAQLHFN